MSCTIPMQNPIDHTLLTSTPIVHITHAPFAICPCTHALLAHTPIVHVTPPPMRSSATHPSHPPPLSASPPPCGLGPSSTPTTNHAACHMALKHFRPALLNCHNTATLQLTPAPMTHCACLGQRRVVVLMWIGDGPARAGAGGHKCVTGAGGDVIQGTADACVCRWHWRTIRRQLMALGWCWSMLNASLHWQCKHANSSDLPLTLLLMLLTLLPHAPHAPPSCSSCSSSRFSGSSRASRSSFAPHSSWASHAPHWPPTHHGPPTPHGPLMGLPCSSESPSPSCSPVPGEFLKCMNSLKGICRAGSQGGADCILSCLSYKYLFKWFSHCILCWLQ